jgi:hypothetical protein
MSSIWLDEDSLAPTSGTPPGEGSLAPTRLTNPGTPVGPTGQAKEPGSEIAVFAGPLGFNMDW